MSIFVRVVLFFFAFVVASCATPNTTLSWDAMQYGGGATIMLDPTRKISVQDCTKSIAMDGGNLLCTVH